MATLRKTPVSSQLDEAPKPPTVCTHDDIAGRAYQCWLERGCPEGSPEVDWYRAEQLLDLSNGAVHETKSNV